MVLAVSGYLIEMFLKLRGLIVDEKKSIIVSALIFALFHLNIWQFPIAFFWGLLLGWIYVKTRSLLLCMLMHALNNAIPFLFMLAVDFKIIQEDPDFYPIWLNLLLIGLIIVGGQILRNQISRHYVNLISEDII